MSSLVIKLEFSLEEVNTVLSGLSGLPYAQVAQLISKLQMQAAPQLAPAPTSTPIEVQPD